MNSHLGMLIRGPHDGGKIRTPGSDDPLPDVLFCGSLPTGDGFVAWSRERSARFPVKYIAMTGGKMWKHIEVLR